MNAFKNFFSSIKITLSAITLIWMIHYFYNNINSIIQVFDNLSSKYWLIIITSYFFIAFIQAKILLIGHYSTPALSFSKFNAAALINSSSSLVGNFVPSGASLSKIFFLSHFFNESKVRAVTTITKIANVFILTNIILAFIVIQHLVFFGDSTFSEKTSTINNSFVYFFILLVLGGGVLITLLKKYNKKSVTVFIKKLFPDSYSQLLSISTFQCVQQLLYSLILFIYLQSNTTNINFLECCFLIVVSSAALVIALTPGNIGIKEGIYFYLAEIINIDTSIIIPVLLFDRLFQILFISTTALISYFFHKKT